jgi:uncharacterized protein involved in exopolysaccharide biosynthesis
VSKHVSAANTGRPHSTTPTNRPETQMEDDRPFAEIRRTVNVVLRILSQNRWAFFVPFCLVASTVFVLSLYYPRTYQATATFQRRDDPVVLNLPTTEGTGSFEYFRTTMTRDLTSPEAMEEVVANLGLTKDLPTEEDGTLTRAGVAQKQAMARAFAGNISIQTTSPSDHLDVVQITYVGPDAEISRPLVDEVKKTYVRRTSAWMREFLESQKDYFERQAEEAWKQLSAAQREETKLRVENPHIDPQNPGGITLKLAQLEIEARELDLRKRMIRAELDATQQMLIVASAEDPFNEVAANKPTGVAQEEDDAAKTTKEKTQPRRTRPSAPLMRDPVIEVLTQQIAEASLQIDELRASRGMTDEHPEIKALLATKTWYENRLAQHQSKSAPIIAIAEADDQPDEQVAANAPIKIDEPAPRPISGQPVQEWRRWNTEGARLQVRLDTLEAQLRDIDFSIDSNKASIKMMEDARRSVHEQQEAFTAAQTRVETARERYHQHQDTLAKLEPALKAISQGRLVQFFADQPATGSTKPVSPKAITILMLAMVTGALTGVMFVILAEVFDHVYRGSNQVARGLGLPILESIDEIVTGYDRRQRLVRRVVVVPVAVTCGVGLLSVTAALAYTSLERPWAFERLRNIPSSALEMVVGEDEPAGIASSDS